MIRLRTKTVNDGHAKQAGVMIGDWLIDYNGIEMTSGDSLSAAMDRYSGQLKTMRVIRNEKLLSFELRAGPLGIFVEPLDLDSQVLLNAMTDLSNINIERTQNDLGENFKLSSLLSAFIGQKIGINIVDPSKITGAILTNCYSDHFVVEHDGLEFRIPISQIIRAIRSTNGRVSTGWLSDDYAIIVRIFDIIVYKGAVSTGIGIPLP